MNNVYNLETVIKNHLINPIQNTFSNIITTSFDSSYNQTKFLDIPLYIQAKFDLISPVSMLYLNITHLKILLQKTTVCAGYFLGTPELPSVHVCSLPCLPCSWPVKMTSTDCVTQPLLTTGSYLGLASGMHQQEIPKWHRRDPDPHFLHIPSLLSHSGSGCILLALRLPSDGPSSLG